jgi:hypothetical protein
VDLLSGKDRQYLFEAFADQTRLLTKDPDESTKKKIEDWIVQVAKYEKECAGIQSEAKDFDKDAKTCKAKAEHMHHIGDQYDLGELGIEFGLVLCSVAVLTKRNGFWFTGMSAALIGAGLAGVGLFQQYVAH